MKIIQVIPVLALGGAETMCENLTYELMNQGHEVIVLSLYSTKTPITERMERANVDIRYLDKKSGLDFSIFKKIKEILKKENPDVVHAHLYSLKYVVPQAHSLGIKKIVYTVHSIAQKESGKLSRMLNKFFFKKWGVVPVGLSELVRDTVVDVYKMPPEKVPFVYNGVDLGKCVPKESYEFGETIKIVHVGRFCEAKNHSGLVKAFARVHKVYSATKLYLIGDGEEREGIEKYVAEIGLQNDVVFLGSQSDVFSYLKDMDIFTLPSNYEGIPLSLAEAMGTGLPIVATAVGGIPDMVKDGESALLTTVDEKQIADALIRLVEDKMLRECLGRNALVGSKAFSSEEMANKYLEIYGA